MIQWVSVPLNYDCGLWGSEMMGNESICRIEIQGRTLDVDSGVFVAECFIGKEPNQKRGGFSLESILSERKLFQNWWV